MALDPKPFVNNYNLVWDINTLTWVKETQPEGGGGGGPTSDVNVTNSSLAVTGPLTDTQLRAADVKITLDGESVPVTGTFWQATQPVSGTVTANAGTNLNTSALALDASLSTLNTSVNTLLKPANTLTAVTTVGAVTSITNALPAGSNAIGKLAANSGVDIGDVDVTSLPALPAGNNNIGDVDIATIAAGDNNIGNVDVVTMPAITGTVTANAGTNLNTSLLALEAGNLATLTAKDFATQTTLASVLAELLTKTEPADQQHTVIDGEVNDGPSSGLAAGDIANLSISTDGRLRVSTVIANTYLEFFNNGAVLFDSPALTSTDNPWSMGVASPWPS